MHHDDALERVTLGVNAPIPFTTIKSSGPACRPLDFPAPIVDRAMTVSSNVVNHRTGDIFRANSVLMRRPTHAKNCPSRGVGDGQLFSSYSSENRLRGHHRWSTAESINSGHFHGTAPSTASSTFSPQRCDAACNLPEKAYCVRKKICNTTYGSIRLCVVLKRVSRELMTYASKFIPKNEFATLGILDAAVPEWETTEELVAIKVVSWSKLQSLRGRHLEDPVKELAALQLLGEFHPHVISILDALQDEAHLFCVMPYMSGGDLSSSTGTIDESLARTWFRQILAGISILQKKGVCHRDLCLENLVLDENQNVHIIDFGLCLRIPFADPSNRKLVSDVGANTYRRLIKAQGQCGSWKYMAPEMCMGSESFDGFAIDLWAAGIVLFKLLVGSEPFAMPDPIDCNFCTISKRGDLAGFLSSRGIDLTTNVVDLLQSMMWSDPAKRLTLEKIVNHPWVRGNVKTSAPSSPEGNESWLIKIKSIDDTESANLMLTGLLDSYYGSETDGSTYDTIDAAESNFSIPQVSSPPNTAIESEDSLGQLETKKTRRRWLYFPLKKKWRRNARASNSLVVTSNRQIT